MQSRHKIEDNLSHLVDIIVDYASSPFSLVDGFSRHEIDNMKSTFRDNIRLYVTGLKDKATEYGSLKATKENIVKWE